MNRVVHVLYLSVVVLGPLVMTEAFLVHPTSKMLSTQVQTRSSIIHHHMISSPTELTGTSFSSLILADESWRQYFSLLLIGGVLIDILLGSPLANMALKPLRGDNTSEQDDESNKKKNPRMAAQLSVNKSRERIDSDAVAKAAIERAQNALELRRFLDEKKTDWDRMEEMKRKLDAEMQELDEDLKAREESLKRNSQ